METNLRNLNDLQKEWNGHADEFIDELKPEGIKWIKELIKAKESEEGFFCLDCLKIVDWKTCKGHKTIYEDHDTTDISSMILALKLFCSITEVDIQSSILADKVDDEVARQILEDLD